MLGTLIARKDVAVVATAAGTFLGTALLSLFLPKLIYKVKQQELQEAFENASSNQRLVEAERKRQEISRQLVKAEQEIARLEHMRINLDTFRSVLKLGLLEIDMHITDFRREVIQTDQRTWPLNDRNHVYLGVLKLPIRATLGIDMAKIRLCEDAQGRLLVSNITPSHVVDTREGAHWEMDEVRMEYMNEGKVVEIECDPNEARVRARARDHEKQVRARLKEGEDFEPFAIGLKKAAEQALTALLTPLGKEILFAAEPGDKGEDVLQFLKSHNERLHAKIQEKRESCRRMTAGENS